MQSTPQRTVGGLLTYFFLVLHFGLICGIIFFLSGKNLLKISTILNTDILHRIYTNAVLFVKQGPYAI